MITRIKLAIQKQGRLGGLVPRFLNKAGLDFEIQDRQLFSSCSNFPIDAVLVRHKDIIPFVESKQAHLGIVGSDVYEESQSSLHRVLDLGFAHSALTIAVPKHSAFHSISDLAGKRIATSFPNLTRNFFDTHKLLVDVIHLNGSVEVAPQLDMADAIADLVGTGTTLHLHGLRSLDTVTRSQAILIANQQALDQYGDLIDELTLRFRSVRDAVGKKYLMFNLPEQMVDQAKSIFPGLGGPSIIPVSSAEPTVDMQVVVAETELWEKVLLLKDIGASGIIVLPIENLVQ